MNSTKKGKGNWRERSVLRRYLVPHYEKLCYPKGNNLKQVRLLRLESKQVHPENKRINVRDESPAIGQKKSLAYPVRRLRSLFFSRVSQWLFIFHVQQYKSPLYVGDGFVVRKNIKNEHIVYLVYRTAVCFFFFSHTLLSSFWTSRDHR